MQVIQNLDTLPEALRGNIVLGLGNFDGLHRGHQDLIKHVIKQAHAQNAIPAVLTFQQHPQKVLHPESAPKLLMDPLYKLAMLKQMGVLLCFWLPFDQDFAGVTAKEFVEDILVKKIGVKEVCMGYNARFGYQREGDGAFMEDQASRLGFQFKKIEAIQVQEETVSSSLIRDYVGQGQLNVAAKALGYAFSVLGTVVSGDGRGKQLGFPTANLQLNSEALPSEGVYAAKVTEVSIQLQNTSYEGIQDLHVMGLSERMNAVVNYGKRPTFKNGDNPVMEVHLLDYSGDDLTGKQLEVGFIERLRGEQAFESKEALQSQIADDIEKGRGILSVSP